MAQDMEKVMEMTLDEYIASFKAEKKSSNASVHNCTKSESKFKAERRSNDEGEYDDFKEEMKEESSGIWNGPSASTNYIDLDMPEDDSFHTLITDDADISASTLQKENLQEKQSPRTQNQVQRYQPNFDLRNKISGNSTSALEFMPNSNSQQWRLMQPNVMSQRPAGMPPLVPQNTFEDRRSNQQYKRNRYQKNWSSKRNGFNNNRNSNGNANGSINSNISFNNGRIQRFNQRNYNQEMLNKNIKAVLDQFNESNVNLIPQKVRDLTIECPSDSINLTSDPRSSSTMGFGDSTPAPSVRMTFKVPTHQSNGQSGNNSSKSNDSLRALLGINDTSSLKTEMMPMLASKFLDFFQNVSQQTTHKPIYDMKVQKEIHELQKKPLLYKCPGGEVVSSDGTGINCEIIPRTSGMSLNHRFA